jgi:PAS domain S-box-containing protein
MAAARTKQNGLKKSRSPRPLIVLSGASFLAIIITASMLYLRAIQLFEDNNQFIRDSYTQYVENLNISTLVNMARYVENQYPDIRDTERLRLVAGTPWFWEIAREWKEIKNNFGFAYIYYIEKHQGQYVFLLSSDIHEDSHPEWLHRPVWKGPPPPFVEQAWATGELAYSLTPTVNEWGALISVALPIVREGRVTGILGVDYNVDFITGLTQREEALKTREERLMGWFWLSIILTVAIALLVMGAQIIIGYRSVLVPLLSAEAAEAAREAEERLRIMLDTMAFACFFFDEYDQPVDCNKRALELYGAESREYFLSNLFTVYSPPYQNDGYPSVDRAMEHIRIARENGRSVFVWEHRRGDGSPLPAEITLVRVEWKDGGHRIAAYARDLSRLYETENQLTRVMSVVEHSPNFFIFQNPSGQIEYVNPAVTNVTGLARQELTRPGSLARILTPEDYQRLNAETFTAALENRPVYFDLKVQSQDGGQRDFSFSAFPVRLHDGGTGLGLLGRDVTILFHVQQELAAAREKAEGALAAELDYQNAKGNFLSRVSHEMRTPLHAVISMTEIGKKTLDPEEHKNCFHTIENAAERLLEVVNNILDLTGIDTGTFDFTPAPFNFHQTMTAIANAIQPRAQAKGLNFVTGIDADIPQTLTGDERRLKQILQNLLSNAIKFTPSGGIVSLSAHKYFLQEDQCRIRFEVSDTGTGMDEALRRRIWELFEQGDDPLTRGHSGLGLGLTLTRHIVTLMHGEIQVESEPNKGSRFICDLSFTALEGPEGRGGFNGSISDRDLAP